jgi:hypothetical protein
MVKSMALSELLWIVSVWEYVWDRGWVGAERAGW